MTKTKAVLDGDTKLILEELGIHDIPEKDVPEVVEALLDHFNKVIIETVILNLETRDLERFKQALSGKNVEGEITALAARVPGLAEKIEGAVTNEFAVIRAARQTKK